MNGAEPEKIIDAAASDAMFQRERNRQALQMLLDIQRKKDGHLPALRSRMGKTPSYVTSASLSWIVEKVGFAGDLPIFKGKADRTSKAIPIDESTIFDIQQRQPDWRRQLEMALYLALRPYHKFPPILVVAYQGWVYRERSEEWGPDERAMQDSITAEPLDIEGNYCDLDYRNTYYYALDGQHRLMAIMGLRDLLRNGRIYKLNQDGTRKATCYELDQVIEEIHKDTNEDKAVIHERLQRIMNEEQIGIEIIPAVIEEETYDEAKKRLRGVLVDVNENARKPAKGEVSLLDDTDGFRIAAKYIMFAHPLLGEHVHPTKSQLEETSEYYTTLETLVGITKNYLGQRPEFSKWKTPRFGEKSLGPVRPSDNELENALEKLRDYFDALATLPSHEAFMQGTPAKKLRSRDNDDHILFRPIAQQALAKAVAVLEVDHDISLARIAEKLREQENTGQLKLRNEKAPWIGVLCNPIDYTMSRKEADKDLCACLFRHLLGSGTDDEDEYNDLKKKFAEARRTGDDEKAISLDGGSCEVNEVRLPYPW